MDHITAPYWTIRHPDATGTVIARFDTEGGRLLPDSISEHDDFVVVPVADREALTNTTIDHSGLTAAEKQRLRDAFGIVP
jgi:hypothetical protein